MAMNIASDYKQHGEDVFGGQLWMYLDIDTPSRTCTSVHFPTGDGYDYSDRPAITTAVQNSRNGQEMTESIMCVQKITETPKFRAGEARGTGPGHDSTGGPYVSQGEHSPGSPTFPGSGNNGRSPPLETLIDGVKFSRTFTPTYNIVLLSLLAIFVAMHFSRQVRVFKWPIKRKKTDPKVQAAGPITQRIEMIEQEPLLNYTHASYSTSSQISRRLQAILSYQPLPFNFQKWLSTHHIPIPAPDIQTCIAVFLFYTLNVFYAIYQVPISKTSSIFIFADRLGLLFVVNLPLLYLLAAKNCPLRALTGWSYEQLNVFHRAVGRAMIIMAIGHMGGFVAVWWQLLSKRLSFADFLKLPIISIGMAAGIAFLLLALGAKREIRRLGGYELFLIGHVGLQIIALVALLHHHRNCGNYVLTAFAIWWVDRIVWRFWVAKRVGVCRAWVCGGPGTVGLEVSLQNPAIGDEEGGEGRGKIWKWTAGDHIFLRIPGISKWENHPFTIASHPDDGGLDCGGRFRLIIRGQDGFTARLLERVSTPGNNADLGKAFIDGPYGSCHALEAMKSAEEAVIIAGGSGIAVLWPLAYDLLLSNWAGTSTLNPKPSPYGTTSENAFTKKLNLIWTVRNRGDCAWINPTPPMDLDSPQSILDLESTSLIHAKEQFSKLVELAKKASVEVRLRVYVSGPGGSGQVPYIHESFGARETSSIYTRLEGTISDIPHQTVIADSNIARDDSNSKSAHPSIPTLLNEILCPLSTQQSPPPVAMAAVVVCGPDSMVLETRNVCAKMLWRKDGEGGRNVVCVAEKFGW